MKALLKLRILPYLTSRSSLSCCYFTRAANYTDLDPKTPLRADLHSKAFEHLRLRASDLGYFEGLENRTTARVRGPNLHYYVEGVLREDSQGEVGQNKAGCFNAVD